MAALVRLEGMAERGAHPDDVALDAKRIAAGWWWNARGDLTPDRLALLVQEPRRWCAVASGHYAQRWDSLNRAGRPGEADEARRWAEALERAHWALRLYD